jgi:H+/Cl- antiporter ClcA
MEENDEDQVLPAKATDEDIRKELGKDEKCTNDEGEEEEDTFIYLKSSSIISILIIVIISLVCILTTSLLIKRVLYSHGITRRLSIYLGLTPNRTIDESILTFWQPKSIYDEQPIATSTTIINSSSPPPPPTLSTNTGKKAQTIFRTIILPSLFFLSILCGIFAFYMRLHHHFYPAWGARPKKPEQYVSIELK